MLARGVGDAREGGRRCSRGGSAMLVRGDLQGHRSQSSMWTQCILLDQVPVHMKVDTGADVTAIPETVYTNRT